MRLAAIALVAVVLAGCSGGSPALPESALPRLVLQPGDVPPALERFDEGRQAKADQPGGARAAADRFGRLGGWKARYRRTGSATAAGPLVIESRADLFESDGGAKDELEAFSTDPPGKSEKVELGDEGVLASTVQPAFPHPLRIYVVAWRHGNAVSVVTVHGFRGVSGQQTVALARKQEARMEAAAKR
jgi:hypothetical protein